MRAAQRTALQLRARRYVAHRLVVCFIKDSLAHKQNAVAAPASCKRQLGWRRTDATNRTAYGSKQPAGVFARRAETRSELGVVQVHAVAHLVQRVRQ